MGAPSKTQIEAWSDRIAAILKADLAGFDAELSGATLTSLGTQVDASGDLALEAALLGAANAVDAQSLPENRAATVAALLGRAPIRNFLSALNTHLVSANGGSQASFRAYLTTLTAKVHPLFAEAWRAVHGAAAFNNGSAIEGVFPPSYQSRAADRVYAGADGALAEETTDAGSAGTADVTLFGTLDHALYIGSRHKFSQVVIALSTLANVTTQPAFQYWNGNAWVALTTTDNSAGLTKNDTIKFTPPADWVRHYKDAGGTAFGEKTPLYYLRIARSAVTVGTPPVGTAIRIVPLTVYAAGVIHLGVDQPPLAIVRVTGVNTLVVEPIAGVDTSRFLPAAGFGLRALTPIAGTIDLTLSYTDQGGADSTQAQTQWTSIDALDTLAGVLAGGDTGLRAVKSTGNVSVNTATQGVFEVYAAELRTPAL